MMKRYMQYLIQSAERRTDNFLAEQVKNPADLQYGGIRGNTWEAKPTIYALATAVAVYLNRESRFYKSERLYQGMRLALDFVKRTQRGDGYFDYPSCNFRSAPDTAFCFKRLYAAWRLLKKYEPDNVPGVAELQQEYLPIMHKALEAILVGGFHTPNHRWGIAAALLQGADLFAAEKDFSAKLKARAELYLAEGIDGDDDGEYAERSTGNYNAVVNNAMIAMYEQTRDPSFLGYVRRNLSMMLYYIDPDDTIFTQNSTRQDKGKKEYAGKYFYQYLFMACVEENPVFDGAAHKIIKDGMERGDPAPDCLHIVMAHDEMMTHTFARYGFLDTYRKFFRHSGVLRVKTEKYGYTVIKGKSAFLFFQTGNTPIYVKVGESYCNVRNFVPEEIQPLEDGCVLKGTAEGWYYLPFEEAPGTSDWWAMDHTKREKLISSTLQVTFVVRELENGLEFSVKTEGLDRLPLRFELCIPAGTVLENEHFWLKSAAGENMILREGSLSLHHEENTLCFGPGFGEHEFQGHYSGEELNTTGYTVYCNAYTPVEKTLRLTIES